MELFLQRLMDGLSDGAVYALVALAVVMVYRTTGMLNFAQGEIGMVSAFVVWWLISDSGPGWPIHGAIVFGIVFGMLMGAALERGVVRPFEQGDHLRLTIVGLGVFLVLNSTAAFVFTTGTERMPSPFPIGSLRLGDVSIRYHSLGLLATLLIAGLALWLLFTRTTLGVTLRASSVNPSSSRLVGINVNQNLMTGWALAGGFAALAAILVAPTLYLSTSMMLIPLMYGFAAAVLGGLDSSVGAVIGGLLVGVAQNIVGGYVSFIGTDLQILTAFAIVVAVLLVRPQGLLGRARVVRL